MREGGRGRGGKEGGRKGGREGEKREGGREGGRDSHVKLTPSMAISTAVVRHKRN